MTKVRDAVPKLDNGDRVEDIVTGVTGIITATTVWMNGCIRYVVQPEKPKDGRPVESLSYDENDLKLTKSSAVKRAKVRRTGAPQCGESIATRRY